MRANPGVPGFRATLALALTEGSRVDEARAILNQEMASGFRDLPHDVTWLTVAAIYAHVSIALGEGAAAATLYGTLEPWSEQIAFPAFGVWGPVSLYLGSLALAMGDQESAERQLSEAIRVAAQMTAPHWEARARRHLAQLSHVTR